MLVEKLHLKSHPTEKQIKKQTKRCMNHTKVFRVVMKETVHPETKRVFGFSHQAFLFLKHNDNKESDSKV